MSSEPLRARVPELDNAEDLAEEKVVLKDLSLALNPIKFAKRLGFSELDQWQRDLLLSDAQKVMLLCSRQSGKSTITAILALHHALYHPGALVLVVSPSYRQSTELFRKIAAFFQGLGRPVPSDAENKHTLELSNKSRVLSLPSKSQTIRGFSAPSLIIIDEAAQVLDETYFALTPMLAVNPKGRVILLSTPYGRSGFFYSEWTAGLGWFKLKITTLQCPRISKGWLEEQRASMSSWFWNLEYMCEFESNEAAFFDYVEIANSLDSDIKPLL